MKFNKFIIGLVAAASIGSLGSCSSDYLDLAPETNPSPNDIATNVDNARMALYGICASMNTQYSQTSYNQYNGESYINTLFGDGFGQDYISGLDIAGFGAVNMKMETFDNEGYVPQTIIWGYVYNLIAQANQIITRIDSAEGDEAERDFIKAQALTMRAHAYTKGLMFYAPRWEDSDNGNKYCMVLRTDPDIADVPACTMNDVLDLIYSDLDTAIELFNNNSEVERTYKWEPDLNIAYGTYARAALIKHDYAKAQEMAHNARQGYVVMDNDTYKAGFYTDNDDFMWISSNVDSDIYYWSHGSHYAANGLYVKNWNLGAGAINYDLIRQLDPKDIRREMYLTPASLDYLPSNLNQGKLVAADFWNSKLCDASTYCNLAFGPTSRGGAGADGKWGMYNLAIRFSKYYIENIFNGSVGSIQNDNYFAYYSTGSNGDLLLEKGVYGTSVVTPFGAHYKFFSQPPYGTSQYPYMRCSEMVLAEAEAAYYNGDTPTAIACLNEINGKRIPGYSCNKSGEALLEEIRLTRRIELWGEGHNFTDFKRWNIPLVRTAWQANTTEGWNIDTAGNWPPEVAGTFAPNAEKTNNWRMMVPRTESEYNKAFDKNLVMYP